jgi:hypothetical protein
MPCDTIQTAEVALGKVDQTLLKEAMAALGVTNYAYIQATGELTMRSRGEQPTVAQVKQAYSKQVVFSQAKKYGWKVTETAPNKFEVFKR